jgi:hypothetical protein
MNADTNSVEVLLKGGELLKQIDGPKSMVAREILQLIDTHLILPKRELP